jgi:hypothetical protein
MEVSRGRAGRGFFAGSCPLQVRRGVFNVSPKQLWDPGIELWDAWSSA